MVVCYTKAYQPTVDSSPISLSKKISGFGYAECSPSADVLKISVCLEYRLTSMDDWKDLDCIEDTDRSGSYASQRAEGFCLPGNYRYRTVAISKKAADGATATKRKVSQGLTVDCTPPSPPCPPLLCLWGVSTEDGAAEAMDDYTATDAAIDGAIATSNDQRNSITSLLGHSILDYVL